MAKSVSSKQKLFLRSLTSRIFLILLGLLSNEINKLILEKTLIKIKHDHTKKK